MNIQAGQFVVGVIALCTVPLVMSPTGQHLFFRLYLCLRRFFRPDDFLCESLCWDDIPHGKPLHTPQPQPLHTNQRFGHSASSHVRSRDCWRSSICQFFNNASLLRKVPRPAALTSDFNTNYLQTDLRTLIAYLFCSHSGHGVMGTESGDFANTRLELREHEVVLVAHVKDEHQPLNWDFTKSEVEKIMSGYPPWYRQRVALPHGPVISFPIESESDVLRGGWIVALGLMNPEIRHSNYKPLFLYTVPGGKAEDGTRLDRTNGKHFRRAMRRTKEIIYRFETYFPSVEQFKDASFALEGMIEAGTVSGYANRVWNIAGPDYLNLTTQQAHFAMQIFNTLEPMTEFELAQLKPILLTVVQAALVGVYRVTHYLARQGTRYDPPPLLKRSWDTHVYLVGCGGQA